MLSCQVVEVTSKDALELDTYEDVEIAKCLLPLYNKEKK